MGHNIQRQKFYKIMKKYESDNTKAHKNILFTNILPLKNR